ncbi:RiPP maturation radical SAM C-methyltransferase [Solwaraspora sp. WMMA2080]|uniref:RiPP maturation radical SAM C-methyltransferase n=1 Tax=unclassified Solwaraspora TaxID=2627926 RepID=UPI00248CAC01|nr:MULTISPECIES: RiPP maturation radical SAM C-methyltransferase [unclassified Solwaraspora]WBB97204.1 RiPP maturation radical SAM C-methyltransferase [Solwaraspora sp. WMMA2059]WBC18894.1 RiPP maturation radical SAM C-methyltransferase [Solwaraspora sp. WMMA2080]
MSVCLVAMPWQAIESPSLPIGLLKAVTVATGRPAPTAYHGSLRWAEFLMERSDGELSPADYTEVAEVGLFDGLGDWVFAGVLHDDPEFGVETLRRYAAEYGTGIAGPTAMRQYAADFVELAAAEILATRPSLVGFTTTFMQNVPSLAVARRIRQLDPGVRIAFGGGNCDGAMGIALHRNFPFVDFVVRGEGEVAFPMLLDALDARDLDAGGNLGAGDERDARLARIPGLSWRRADGTARHNPQGALLPPARIPTPDFDDWFGQLAASPVGEYIEPKLVLEGARGCWWGEKHHCTFCGLNGTAMTFRAKPAERMIAEMTELVGRHQTLDVIMVDNIIDNHYYADFLPRVTALGWDLRLHYEVKSNLRPTEIDALRAAGVAHVQPGIESLVSPVLKLMDKGVSGVHNVRTLRDCESAGLTVSWNWLYGFPGERRVDYDPVLRQLPRLVHLQPPAGSSRILLERFSPYFENPVLGFPTRRAARLYQHVYDLPENELADLVYLFDTEPAGLSEQDAEPLNELLKRWTDGYPASALQLLTGLDADETVIADRRVGWPECEHRIADPRLRRAYAELEHGRTVTALAARLAAAGLPVETDRLARWLAELDDAGLVFEENGRWISLATTVEPVKVA